MTRQYQIKRDGDGRLFAGAQIDHLDVRWFNTERAAQRWLNRRRVP